jgi:hypothetical protein
VVIVDSEGKEIWKGETISYGKGPFSFVLDNYGKFVLFDKKLK